MDSYLKDRKLRAVLDGAKSSWFNIFAGVPQGSILAPLLFLIYADDRVWYPFICGWRSTYSELQQSSNSIWQGK